METWEKILLSLIQITKTYMYVVQLDAWEYAFQLFKGEGVYVHTCEVTNHKDIQNSDTNNMKLHTLVIIREAPRGKITQWAHGTCISKK